MTAERVFPPSPPKSAGGPSPAAGGKGADWTKDKRVWGVVGAGIVVVLAMMGRGSSSTTSSGSTGYYDEAPEPAEPAESGSYAGGGDSGMWDEIVDALYARNDALPAEPAELPEQGDTPTAVAPAPARTGKPSRPQRGPKPNRGGKGGKNRGGKGGRKGGKNRGGRGGKQGGRNNGGKARGGPTRGNQGARGGKGGKNQGGSIRERVSAAIPGRKTTVKNVPRQAAKPAAVRPVRAVKSAPRPAARGGGPIARPAAVARPAGAGKKKKGK